MNSGSGLGLGACSRAATAHRMRHRTAQEVVDEALRRYFEKLAAEALARATDAPRHGDYRQAAVPPETEP